MFSGRSRTAVAVLSGMFLGVTCAPVARAQFGGIAVVDFGAIAKLIEEIGVMNNLLNSSKQIYSNAQSQLSEFRTNVTALRNKNWLSFVRNIGVNNTKDSFGETAGMQTAMNTAIGVSTAWKTAAVNPGTLSYLSKEIPGTSQQLSNLATVEMQDSAGETSIKVLGDYRASDLASQAAYNQLDLNIQSTDPAFNTEAAQLNLANAVAMQHLKQQRMATVVHAALLEQQLAANKYQRDAVAGHLRSFGQVNQIQGATEGWKMDPSATAAANTWLVP